jgi:hypothetical protein
MDMATTDFSERLKKRETAARSSGEVAVMLAMARAIHAGDADQAAFAFSAWLFKHQLNLSATAALELLSHALLGARDGDAPTGAMTGSQSDILR